jgi:hypothetical protein
VITSRSITPAHGFDHRESLISGLVHPALEKLANEVIGFDNDDATTGWHGNSLVRTDTRHPVGDGAGAFIRNG